MLTWSTANAACCGRPIPSRAGLVCDVTERCKSEQLTELHTFEVHSPQKSSFYKIPPLIEDSVEKVLDYALTEWILLYQLPLQTTNMNNPKTSEAKGATRIEIPHMINMWAWKRRKEKSGTKVASKSKSVLHPTFTPSASLWRLYGWLVRRAFSGSFCLFLKKKKKSFYSWVIVWYSLDRYTKKRKSVFIIRFFFFYSKNNYLEESEF